MALAFTYTWYSSCAHMIYKLTTSFFGAAEYAQIYAGIIIIFSSLPRIPPRHYVLWVCEHMICMYGTLGHEWVFYVQSFTYLRLSYRLCVLYRFTLIEGMFFPDFRWTGDILPCSTSLPTPGCSSEHSAQAGNHTLHHGEPGGGCKRGRESS